MLLDITITPQLVTEDLVESVIKYDLRRSYLWTICETFPKFVGMRYFKHEQWNQRTESFGEAVFIIVCNFADIEDMQKHLKASALDLNYVVVRGLPVALRYATQGVKGIRGVESVRSHQEILAPDSVRRRGWPRKADKGIT